MASPATPVALRALARFFRLADARRRHDAAVRTTREGRSGFYEAAWREAAAGCDGAVTRLDGGLLEIVCGEVRLRVHNNLTSLDDAVTLQVAGDKPLVYGLLEQRGIPVPAHVVCPASDLSHAHRFLSDLGRPCVIKPARRTGAGVGVTTGVSDLAHLALALAHAGAHCPDVLVEEQVDGQNLRLLYLDGELLDSIQRLPPAVRGDGTSSIGQLIGCENAERLRLGAEVSQTLLSVDSEMRGTLRGQGYRVQSVPAAGTVVRLKSVVNDNRGDDNLSVADLCPDIVAVGARAAEAVGVRLAGVDVITPDPSRSLDETGGVVLEVNTTPGYYYHYYKRDGRVPVATLILERLTKAGA